MFVKITSQEPFNIISLSEAKAQCRLFDSESQHDTFLLSCIEQASALAQSYTNKMLSSGVVSAAWYGYRAKVRLWGDNIESVDSVIGKDSKGNSVTIEGFSFNSISQILSIPPDYSNLSEFAASYTCATSIPSHTLKAGTLHLTEYLFNNRGDTTIGLSVESMPLTAARILDAEKTHAI